jgi:phosphatidylglycerophosphate synthase
MTLLERLLRALLQAGVDPSEVRVELSPGASIGQLVPAELATALPLRWSQEDSPLARRLLHAVRDAEGEPLLAFAGDSIVDARLIQHLLQENGNIAFIDGEASQRGALLRFEEEPSLLVDEDPDLLAMSERCIRSGFAKEFARGEFEGYIVNLRRKVRPYLFRVAGERERARVERFLFRSNYKGSTDFMTKYVYPPIVWQAVRFLADRRLHPNWVTLVDVVAAFAAIPLFAMGLWIPGLLLAYLMSVLDSVDGKLARLTFTSSRMGEILDHGLDIIHPPLWYLAWGWALGGGVASSAPFQLAIWMLAFYTLDRLTAPLFKWRTGRSIHGYASLDVKMRTFISRRNVNLPIFTVALLLDAFAPGMHSAEVALYFIVAWQAASLVYHVERVAHFWRPQPELAASSNSAG